jgi:2-C-methyl-D-erythritol 2,4-cyclodiphosphate synthase
MIRTGIGFDVHRLKKGRRLVMGGVTIKFHLGLAGHSDADVLCHAVIDALLGAAADGDIGTHFPDTRKRWRGADSLKLLASIARRLKSKKIFINNIDSTILAEKPRLTPYRNKMRSRLARAIGISKDRVSVKATTMEGLGALGRGEGIAALAAVNVECRMQNEELVRKKANEI